MEYKIVGYEPERFFHFFEEISAIPRGVGQREGHQRLPGSLRQGSWP